jgi:dipeptidase
MEVTTAGQWIAQRVPDDSFVVLANRFRIAEADLNDSARFLAGSNLVAFATEKGWHDPGHGPFDFCRSYGAPTGSPYSSRREWRGNCVLSGKEFSQEGNLLAVVPLRKLTPRDLMTLLRDHYEGSAFDLTQSYQQGSPHHTSERTICVMKTDASTVVQLRSWLPPEIGGLFWFSAGTPCSSGFVPYYLGVSRFPKPYAWVSDHYDHENAFWEFNSMENLVDQFYADKGRTGDGPRAIDYVAGRWKAFEDREFATQTAVEKTALELYEKDKSLACSFLTTHSCALGLEAFVEAQEIADNLRTKHYR